MPSIAGNPIGNLILLVMVLAFLWGVVGTHQRRRNLKRLWSGWGRSPDWANLVDPVRLDFLMRSVGEPIQKAEKNRKTALYITLCGLVIWITVNLYIYEQISQGAMDADTQLFSLLSIVLLFFPNFIYQHYLKLSVMPRVADSLGYVYRRKGIGVFNALRQHENDIVFASGKRWGVGRSSLLFGDYDRYQAEDGFEMLSAFSYEQSPWQASSRPRISMEEIQTYTERRRQDREEKTVQFKGLLVRIDFNEDFMCPVLLREDLGGFLNRMSFAPPGMQRVILEDPQFENLFEIYGTDQVSTRRILTPRFMEKIKQIAEMYRAPVEVLFAASSVFITVRTSRNHFELGHMFRPVTSPKAIGRVLAQIELQHQVAESLEG